MVPGAETLARIDDYRDAAIGCGRGPGGHNQELAADLQRLKPRLPHRGPSRVDQGNAPRRRPGSIEHSGLMQRGAMGIELGGGQPIEKRLERDRRRGRAPGLGRPLRGASQRAARGQDSRSLVNHRGGHPEFRLDEGFAAARWGASSTVRRGRCVSFPAATNSRGKVSFFPARTYGRSRGSLFPARNHGRSRGSFFPARNHGRNKGSLVPARTYGCGRGFFFPSPTFSCGRGQGEGSDTLQAPIPAVLSTAHDIESELLFRAWLFKKTAPGFAWSESCLVKFMVRSRSVEAGIVLEVYQNPHPALSHN